jgi:hypothetical protein
VRMALGATRASAHLMFRQAGAADGHRHCPASARPGADAVDDLAPVQRRPPIARVHWPCRRCLRHASFRRGGAVVAREAR